MSLLPTNDPITVTPVPETKASGKGFDGAIFKLSEDLLQVFLERATQNGGKPDKNGSIDIESEIVFESGLLDAVSFSLLFSFISTSFMLWR